MEASQIKNDNKNLQQDRKEIIKAANKWSWNITEEGIIIITRTLIKVIE